jgi:hypothetical protein
MARSIEKGDKIRELIRLQLADIQTVIQTNRRLDSFLCEGAQKFEAKYSKLKLKIKNLQRLMSFPRLFQWNHSHADPIWPDGTFNERSAVLEVVPNGIYCEDVPVGTQATSQQKVSAEHCTYISRFKFPMAKGVQLRAA